MIQNLSGIAEDLYGVTRKSDEEMFSIIEGRKPSPVKSVKPGDTDPDLWCSIHGRQTEHIFGFYNKSWLHCVECNPEIKELIRTKYNWVSPEGKDETGNGTRQTQSR